MDRPGRLARFHGSSSGGVMDGVATAEKLLPRSPPRRCVVSVWQLCCVFLVEIQMLLVRRRRSCENVLFLESCQVLPA